MRRLCAVTAAALVVGVSLVIDPRPQFDPQGWLLWGREITSPALRFSTESYPSWKPLPFLAALPLALSGSAAPVLWLALERVGALVGLGLAYSIARRAAGRFAGVLAVVAVATIPGWVTFAIDGRSEPLVLALVLGATITARLRRERLTLALLVLAALDRPEALSLVVLYLVLWRPDGWRERILAACMVLVVPLAWLGGDWLGSRDFFHAAHLARASGGHAGTVAGVTTFARELLKEASPPLLLASVVAAVVAWRRLAAFAGSWIALSAMAAAWLVADALLVLDGYPVSQIPRFILPACALVRVAGSIGAVQLLTTPVRRRARAVALAAVIVLCLPFAWQAGWSAVAGFDAAAAFARNVATLDDAVADAHGRALLRCHRLAVDQWAAMRLAWDLDVMPSRVDRRPRSLAVVLALEHARYPMLRAFERRQGSGDVTELRRFGRWDTLYLGRVDAPCVEHLASVLRKSHES